MVSQFLADRTRRDSAAAQSLDPQREAQRSIALPVLDLTNPAPTGRTEADVDGILLQRHAQGGAMFGEGHALVSPEVKRSSSSRFHYSGNDFHGRLSHDVNMAGKHDWYLREWFGVAGLKQFDLVTKLDYPRGTAHKLWHGIQPYRRENVEEISDLLNIAPFELLMPPEDAMALRRLRNVIAEVAKAEPKPVATEAPEEAQKRTA